MGGKIIDVNLIWQLIWPRSSERRQGPDPRWVRGRPDLEERGGINGNECARNYHNQETEEHHPALGLLGYQGGERANTTRRIGDRRK